jgi:DNA processing protein
VAHTFALALARAGVAIVSGFARGVDAVCHRAALEAAGGSTVAVHGCGLDLDYPSGQRPLARRSPGGVPA